MDVGKTCELKSYPKLLQGAMKLKTALHANRCGIIPLHTTYYTFRTNNTTQIRFVIQIGQKLGIDHHKQDNVQVYTALGVDIEQIKDASKIQPLTPLWYLIRSEELYTAVSY